MAAWNNLNGLIGQGSHPLWFKAIIYLGCIRRENKNKDMQAHKAHTHND